MARIFRRYPNPDELETDDESDAGIDDNLRLRTVTTAASTIAESIRSEQRAARRNKRKFSTKSRFFGRADKRGGSVRSNLPQTPPQEPSQQRPVTSKPRRKIYVNSPLPAPELKSNGDPWVRYVRNKVRTSS